MNKQLRLIEVGEVKTAKDNRQYYSATFQDPANPFAGAKSRIFFQQKNSAGEPVWKGAHPDDTKKFVGKLIPGEIVTAEVEPYEIGERTVNIHTAVVLGNELAEQVFKQQGRVMLKEGAEATPAAVAAPAEQLVIS